MALIDLEQTAVRGEPPPSGGARPVWMLVGSVATVVALGFGCLNLWSWLDRQSETTERTYLQSASRIVVETDSGDVHITPGAPGQVYVRQQLNWSYVKPKVTQEWADGTLTLGVQCSAWNSVAGGDCQAGFTLRVPADAAVEVHDSSGNVEADGLSGGVNLQDDSGDVTADGDVGAVTAHTSSGDVKVDEANAPTVDAASDSGDVTVSLAVPPTRVTARSSSGDVTVTVPPGSGSYAVRANTDSGDTSVNVPRDDASPHAISATTDSGDVNVNYGDG